MKIWKGIVTVSNRSIEELQNILNRIDTHISNCDSKVSTVLGCIGVLFGVFFVSDYVTKYFDLFMYIISNLSFFHVLLILGGLFSLIATGCGICFLMLSLVARVDSNIFKEKSLKTRSLIFFQSVSLWNKYEEFQKKLKFCDKEALKDDYISQIYMCSKICSIKYRYYGQGMKWTVIGFIIWCIITTVCVLCRKIGV